jgi:alginate O-acetyltransferase complex protein AlgJ
MQSELPILPGTTVDAPPASRGGPTDPSHDARLRRGILATDVSRAIAAAMVGLFCLLIYGVPVSQAVLERAKGDDSVLPELFRHFPTKESLRQFEDDVDQASYAKDITQPRMQEMLTRFGRVGNKRAVVGLDGWLYYRPGIAFVGGPGFLDSDTVASREKAALDSGDSAIHADPRPAIFAFHDVLAKRGIPLVLFPVPDKAMLQPLQLHGRGDRDAMPVARNIDWSQFAGEMRAHGVAMFDPTPPAIHRGEDARFLVQDTHWTPDWMEEVAGALADFVTRVAALPPLASPPVLRSVAQTASALGDVAVMLKLPESQTIFTPQETTIHAVHNEADEPWESDPKGDVLLLGDSFTNVFSMEPMGWGTAAGLGPQLALSLGRGVDVIAQNDSGAFATREALARALGAGDDRLAGKKVVIWEFASRELSVGDWKPVDWTAADVAKAALR